MIEDMTIRKFAPKTQASYIRAVKNFTVTLGRGEITERMPFVREPCKLPVVLSPEEVARFLEAAPGLISVRQVAALP